METSFSLPEEMEKPTHGWGQAMLGNTVIFRPPTDCPGYPDQAGHSIPDFFSHLLHFFPFHFRFLSHPSIPDSSLISYCHLFSFPCPTYTSSPSYGTITPTDLIQQLSLCLRNKGTNIHGVISQKIIIFSLFFTIPYTFQLQTTKLQDSKSVKLHC